MTSLSDSTPRARDNYIQFLPPDPVAFDSLDALTFIPIEASAWDDDPWGNERGHLICRLLTRQGEETSFVVNGDGADGDLASEAPRTRLYFHSAPIPIIRETEGDHAIGLVIGAGTGTAPSLEEWADPEKQRLAMRELGLSAYPLSQDEALVAAGMQAVDLTAIVMGLQPRVTTTVEGSSLELASLSFEAGVVTSKSGSLVKAVRVHMRIETAAAAQGPEETEEQRLAIDLLAGDLAASWGVELGAAIIFCAWSDEEFSTPVWNIQAVVPVARIVASYDDAETRDAALREAFAESVRRTTWTSEEM